MTVSTRPLRILHLYAGNLYGGIEKLLLTLAQERERCPQMQPEFALCFEGRLSKELRAAGVPVYMLGEVRLSRPWTTWSARARLKRLMRAEPRFDVAIAHASWPNAVMGPAVRASKTPLWFWAHDTYANMGRVDRAAARVRPDHIIANSQCTWLTIPAIFPNVAGEVLFYPLPDPPPMDRALARQKVRQELGCALDSTVFYMGARLEPWKGHTLLIDALSLLPAGNWEAWIAGGPQRAHEQVYYDQLRAKTRERGLEQRVRWLGQRNDVPRLLAAADVHCQPNTGPEPFGIVFIEALQAGLPVVTTRIGAAPEIVDETCGKLVEPADPTALASALAELLDPARRAALNAGPARARALCDAGQQLYRLYDQLRKRIAP
jgi:glycosyltransferase involved in cell wall biosynthesis